MMEVRIRHGKKNDLQGALSLVKELAVYEKEPDAVTAQLEDYENAFDEGRLFFQVAETSGNIVGIALYYFAFSTWKGKMMYLEDFVVQEAYRSKGIGQQLFDAFLKDAKSKKCQLVKWEVLDWNKDAIRFYVKNGATIEKCWYDGKIYFND